MDTRAFYHKYLTDLGYDQARQNGAVANFLPNLQPGQSTSVWGDVATFVPMVLYRYYGDITAFTRHYPMMKAWVDYIHREDQKHSAHDLFDFGFQFGDWLALDGKTDQSVFGGTDSYFISSAYYYASAQKVAQAAEVLGKKEEADYYSQLAERIRQAILREYFTPNGRLAIDTQTGYLVALRFGIYHDKQRLIDG